MKKFLSLLLAAAMLCTLLVGCGRDRDGAEGGNRAAVEGRGVSSETIRGG